MELKPGRAAEEFALRAHGDQRYGEQPYAVHLRAVAKHLELFGDEAVALGWLHDTVEDTEITLPEIEAHFGAFVAECVGLLSDEPGKNRKERKARTYAKLALVKGAAELALVVKVADRLANLEACHAENNQGLLQMYRLEHEAFRGAAHRPGLCDALWQRLDRLIGD